ncbi:hypothetical protein CSUI_006519 [Cystoisospora suis]|uniref:Transmembrane protein n=1 Tax=Cystoisospora suis TaxID=483139 RepID=A0A2C6KGM8_9APIC|nr:hypothetical protein CSUI_006519 [Cystoisospora suis]
MAANVSFHSPNSDGFPLVKALLLILIYFFLQLWMIETSFNTGDLACSFLPFLLTLLLLLLASLFCFSFPLRNSLLCLEKPRTSFSSHFTPYMYMYEYKYVCK